MDVARDRIIEYIGSSDEEAAHLRLLMRSLASRLAAPWRWGAETAADLLLVDPDTLAGDMARGRAQAAGIRCAVVTSDPGAVSGDFVLVRPFKASDFLQVLESASAAADSVAAPAVQIGGFFDFEDNSEAQGHWQAEFEHLDFDARAEPPPPGLDEAEALFRRDPTANKPSILMPDPLDPGTAVEWTGDGSLRSELRMTRADIRAGGGAPNIDPAMRRVAPRDDSWHWLVEYLADGMLGGPSRIAPAGLPPLVLDPKEKTYLCDAALPALEPYFGLQIKRSYWLPMTSASLAAARASAKPHPYDRLRWLGALLAGNGRLASHLDPGGVYRLRQWFAIASEYPHACRISTAMLRPARLHEITAACGLPMEEVFNVVNAWDAIGYVELQPRERLR